MYMLVMCTLNVIVSLDPDLDPIIPLKKGFPKPE